MTDKDRSFVIRTACLVLAVSVLAMIFTLLAGLFDPKVDNDKIFAILGPSYQTIIGCLVGMMGGLRLATTTAAPPTN